MSSNNNDWELRTRLGRMVQNGGVTSIDQALETGLPFKEPQLASQLPPGLDGEAPDINTVQRMADSGRRVKFRCAATVGSRNGYLGYAETYDDQVGGVIQEVIEAAKLNIIKVDRGSGLWEDRTDGLNSLSRKTEDEAGSVAVCIIPAPQGPGLATAKTVRNILGLAGVQDAWTKSGGDTRTTVNLVKVTYNALKNASQSRTPWCAREARQKVCE